MAGQHTEQNTGAEKLEEGIPQTVEHIGGEHQKIPGQGCNTIDEISVQVGLWISINTMKICEKVPKMFSLVLVCGGLLRPLFFVPIPHHKSHLSHMNIFLRHYGGQLKTVVEQEACEKIGCKR